MLVCLDPGHGGKDSGGSANGLKEKDLVLDIALKTKALLMGRGFSVLMTRDTDEYVSITARHEMATAAGADLFISIHTDAFYETSHGFSVIFYKAASRDTIGVLMKEQLLAVHDDWNRWIYGDYVGVLVHATMPAILTENLFVTNKQEAALLADDGFRTKLAEAHARAICRYFGIPYEMGGDEDMAFVVYALGEQEKQGDLFVWGTPEGFTKSPYFPSFVDCWLNFYNENTEAVEVLLWVNHEGSKTKWPVSYTLQKYQRHSIPLDNLVGDQTGFSIIVKCKKRNIMPTVSIYAK